MCKLWQFYYFWSPYTVCAQQKKTKKIGFSSKSLLLLILCAAASGISDFSQKLFVQECVNDNISLFNLYVYLFSSGTLLLASFIVVKTQKTVQRSFQFRFIKPVFGYITVMALCLYLNSYFKTIAAGYMDAVLLYPLNQGCAVVMSLTMSVVIFREKLGFKSIIGVAMAATAVILLSVA